MSIVAVVASLLFVTAFIIISSEKISKTLTALLGAGIFLLSKFIDQESAFHHIDWNVVFLLIGMMIIVGLTKRSGLFQFLAIKTAKLAKGSPALILILLSLLTALLSALLDNVTTILIITPVTILIAVELGLSPIPFIISEAVASNIGGAATLIGDPPNIMIGSAAGFGFIDFLLNMGPVVLLILPVYSVTVYLLFRKKLKVSNERRARIMEFDESRSISDHKILRDSLIILTLVIIGFMTHDLHHIGTASIALTGAALLMLLTDRHEVEEFFNEVEWSTIFFFIGLFIMVGTLIEAGVISRIASLLTSETGDNISFTSVVIIWMSAIVSAFVDNIPYVATMIPLVEDMAQQLGDTTIRPVWWALAMGSCFGGNGTLVGASANVIAAGISGRSGYKISFITFSKYGSIITLITLLISTVYLIVRYL